MKNRNRFRHYLSVQALVVLLVLGTFQMIQDRPIAALVAGSLFLFSTLGIMWWESRYPGYYKRISFIAMSCFLVLSVLPILVLRLVNWGQPFHEIQMFGIFGPQLHQFSNYLFIAVMITFFIDAHLQQVKDLNQN